MPTMEWIGKDKVINHHQDVPYRILDEKYTFNSTKSENKIIHGDNLDALKALIPEYEGKIKCIYIDPPYNTGEEGWVYNDNVNDPKIKKWLGEVVGKEGEDLSRHDKWLCMMYPRLKLLQKLLSDDGAIFISINDNEQANLKLISDEIFGAHNFIAQIVWQKKYGPANDATYISETHDYVMSYAKNKYNWFPHLLDRNDQQLKDFKNPDNDPRGLWRASDLSARTYSASTDYPITGPNGNIFNPPASRSWIISKDKYNELLADNRITFGTSGSGRPMQKKFLSEVKSGITIQTWWDRKFADDNKNARYELKKIFPLNPFSTPKPSRLIERILQISTAKDSIILDSFAGSGTTAHAVLKLNKQDGGNRKFILVEMEDYAENITAERVRRVISGYPCDDINIIYDKKITLKSLKNGEKMITDSDIAKNSVKDNYSEFKKEIIDSHLVVTGTRKSFEDGTGGDFTYYELGEPLLTPDGNLNENIDTEKIRNYIWFTETSTSLPVNKKINDTKYYLGTNNDTSYYFAYEKDKLTDLNYQLLTKIKTKTDNYVIYADTCTLSQKELTKLNITFRKIPRDITKL